MDQVTGLLGNRGGRGASRSNGGLAGKAAGFVTGFLSGGEQDKRKRRGGRRRR
jgi:hypothetical protein